MNQIELRVYRRVKSMRAILIFLCFHAFIVQAQTVNTAFELERFPPSAYNAVTDYDDGSFSDIEAFETYFQAYKLQRSQSPEAYFSAPVSADAQAAREVLVKDSDGEAAAFISFLESEGSLESMKQLLGIENQHPALLPYRFFAAYFLEDISSERAILNKMDQLQMISPVLKNYGYNSLLSASGSNFIISQGIQDLIGIRYQIHKNQASFKVLNAFAEALPGYKGLRIKNLLESTAAEVWIAPTVANEHITLKNKYNPVNKGIGIGYGSANEVLMLNVLSGFSGLENNPLTPADEGLIKSYLLFTDLLSEMKFENPELEKKAKEIIDYTKKFQAP